ncbi:phospholipase, partial [Candidatus Bipolaricaulota bacterium]|nr:phospholipase [Candidatus Bipolaricaulota bacterium]
MRKRSRKGNVTVHAIAGTEVVLLGMNAVEKAAEGLLGFHIYKKQEGSDEKPVLLGGERTFEGHEKPDRVIQGFLWGDYEVDPKTTYSYRVVPVYGTP